MNNNIDTILFDLDGTLLNSINDLKISVNYAVTKYKYPKQTLDMVRNNVGDGIEKLLERSLPEKENCPNYEECLIRFKEHYFKNMTINTKPYKLVLETLITLHNKGIKIGVVSNKIDVGVKELCKKYFKSLIDFEIGQTQGVLRKPAPDMVYIALDELNSTPERTLFIGDSDVDIQTAANSNIKFIGVSWGYKTKEFLSKNGASVIIDTPLEILNYI